MLRLLTLQLIIGIIILKFRDITANEEELNPAQLCKNPMVTSATRTPYGIICMIPRPVPPGESHIEKRQQFVRSQPKLLKSEQNEHMQAKFVPSFKLIPNQLTPQTNVLMKRSIFSNWFQKFYESLYKTVYKSLKNTLFRNINAEEQQQQQKQQILPHQQQYQQPLVMPLINPDQLTPDGQEIRQQFQFDPNSSPLLPQQESRIISNFIPSMGQKPVLGPDFNQPFLPMTLSSDLNSGESIPFGGYNSDDISENEPVIDETRLGAAVHDLPQYNYGSVRQLATYLQSIQEKINRQKNKNSDEDRQTEGSELINDYSSLTADSSNDKHEFVIPLYTDLKVKGKSRIGPFDVRSQEEVRRPRKLVYEFHGYKKDMDCKGRFKPLKSEAEKEQPVMSSQSSASQLKSKSRRKRYIELDYGQMQLRKLPIWFNRNGPHSEAIVEVKPRSLFRFEQPMLGWKPIMPPELLRKDLFLKRNGDPLANWDHEQVESQNNYQWLRPDNETNDKNQTSELTDAELMTIEALKNLDLSKSSVIIDRRNYRNIDYNNRNSDYYSDKEQQTYSKAQDITNENRYVPSTSNPFDNQVIESESQSLNKDPDNGIKAVEVENVGDDVTKIRSLEEIAALPGAVIKPIDPTLTNILLKVLSHNSDFSQKRITNAYFLEFPKLPNYKPSTKKKSQTNYILPADVYSQSPGQTPVESILNVNYDLDYEKDIKLTDDDYEYGEIVCANKMSGGVADIRKGCRIYFQCTPFTIDTYVCPRGSLFDTRKQFCLPSHQVSCGTYS